MAKHNTGDPETDEILDEMAAEGLELPVFANDADPDESGDGETHDPELEESADETEEEGEEDDSTDDEEDEDDSSDEEDEEEEDDDDEDESDPKTKKRLGLVDKYKLERKKSRQKDSRIAELEGIVDGLKSGSTEAEFDKELTAFAEKNKMSVEVARGLIDLAAKRAGLPKDVMADLKAAREERERREYWGTQRKSFDKDFRGNVMPVLRSMGASRAEIARVYDTLNGDVSADGSPRATGESKYWAWDKANKGKSLVSLALELRGATATRISSEGGSRGRNRSTPTKDPGDLTPADINEMSDEEFDAYSDNLGKNQRITIHRA